ncbi:phage tail tape measure protein [Rhodomicrobium lacus]|uniref:phage tail tape measure protein n=1 Tax=Rhodomicrobium lacus TaxID=2498452 RepID=UPI000F8D8179|nr:phage tail tape measure protein [Rhodomicrobium lacus]
MANLSASLIIRMIDGVSGPARAAAQALRGIGLATAALNRNVGVVAIGKEIGAQAKSMSEASQRLSSAVAPVAMAGGFGFFKAFEFEKAMNTMEALGELTAAQRKDAEDYIKLLSTRYPKGLTQLAQTTNELLRGGLDIKAAMGALSSTMDLAIYGDIEPKNAAEIAINALNQFRMPMSTVEEAAASMQKVADTIAYAANKSNTDVRLMGETFKYAAPMATALGMSMDELSAAAMIMANNGIKGSEAGVAIRSAMVRMIKGTPGMNAMLERLNINLRDFIKNGREVTAVDVVSGLRGAGIDATPLMSKIEEAFKKPELKASQARMVTELTKIISEGMGSSSIVDKEALATHLTETLTAAGSKIDLIGFIREINTKAGPNVAGAIAHIFDVRQGARLMTMAAGDVRQMLDDITKDSTGYAAKGAQIMLKGIVGPVYAVISAFESFFVSVGKSGVFEDMAEAFKSLAQWINRLGESNRELLRFGAYSVAALAVLGPLGLAMSGAAAAVRMFAAAMKIAALAALFPFSAAITGVWKGFLGLAAVSGRVAAGLRAVAVAAALGPMAMLSAGAATALTSFGALARSIWPVVRLVARLSLLGGAVATAGTLIYQNWSQIKQAFADFGSGFQTGFWDNLKPSPELNQAWDGLKQAILDAGVGLNIPSWRELGVLFGGALAEGVNLAASGISKIVQGLTAAVNAARDAARWIGSIKMPSISLPSWGSSAPATGGQSVPARAAGGPVLGGQAYLVGEKGPELFVPGRSGSIVPNRSLGAPRFGSGGYSFGPINIAINGASNVREIADQVGDELEARLRRLMRGLQADYA